MFNSFVRRVCVSLSCAYATHCSMHKKRARNLSGRVLFFIPTVDGPACKHSNK
jgi:hypothetical protein